MLNSWFSTDILTKIRQVFRSLLTAHHSQDSVAEIVQILDLHLYLEESQSTCPLYLQIVVMIVGHHLFRCLYLYFVLDWFYFYIEFAVRLLGPLPLIFMMVFLYFGLSFWCHVLCFFSLWHCILLFQYMDGLCTLIMTSQFLSYQVMMFV